LRDVGLEAVGQVFPEPCFRGQNLERSHPRIRTESHLSAHASHDHFAHVIRPLKKRFECLLQGSRVKGYSLCDLGLEAASLVPSHGLRHTLQDLGHLSFEVWVGTVPAKVSDDEFRTSGFDFGAHVLRTGYLELHLCSQPEVVAARRDDRGGLALRGLRIRWIADDIGTLTPGEVFDFLHHVLLGIVGKTWTKSTSLPCQGVALRKRWLS